MKKINKSIKLVALLIACLAIPSLAGAQVVNNMYFNIDWDINSPFGNDFADKTSGWGAHGEAGYYVVPNFAVGAFISYHTNNKYIDRQTLNVAKHLLSLLISNILYSSCLLVLHSVIALPAKDSLNLMFQLN